MLFSSLYFYLSIWFALVENMISHGGRYAVLKLGLVGGESAGQRITTVFEISRAF